MKLHNGWGDHYATIETGRGNISRRISPNGHEFVTLPLNGAWRVIIISETGDILGEGVDRVQQDATAKACKDADLEPRQG